MLSQVGVGLTKACAASCCPAVLASSWAPCSCQPRAALQTWVRGLAGPRAGDSFCPLRTAPLLTVPCWALLSQVRQSLTHASPVPAAEPCAALAPDLLLPAAAGYTRAGWVRAQALGPLHCPTSTLGWEKLQQIPGLGGCTLTPCPSFCCSFSAVRKSLGCACTEKPVSASLFPCWTPV